MDWLGPVRPAAERGAAVARHAGELARLTVDSARAVVTGRVRWSDMAVQLYDVGVRSLPLAVVTAVLSGIVTSQQGGHQMTSTIPLYVLGSVATNSIVLELGPVLTAIVIIGRVGARITAELGTMKVSEQVDALHALGRDPVAVLAAPRIVAGVLAMPALVAIANAVGAAAALVAARLSVGLGPSRFCTGRGCSGTALTCSIRCSRRSPSAS